MTIFNKYNVVLSLLTFLILLSGYWLFRLYTTDETAHSSSVVQKQTHLLTNKEVLNSNEQQTDSTTFSLSKEKKDLNIPHEKTMNDKQYNKNGIKKTLTSNKQKTDDTTSISKEEKKSHFSQEKEINDKQYTDSSLEMKEGLYVVFGVYKSKSNAINFQKTCFEQGYNTILGYDLAKEFYYVYKQYFELNQEAQATKEVQAWTYHQHFNTAWLYKILSIS